VQHASLLATSSVAWPARGARVDAAAAAPRADATAIALVDRDVAGGAAFANAARARGTTVLEFGGDVARIWMRELEPRLRAGPVAIAGHTSAATAFCLELLARDFGARTVELARAGAAVSFVISQSPGRRAALAPAAVRAQWSNTHA
jgi:hypothetical protein